MTLDEFKNTLGNARPSNAIGVALVAMWHAKKGDWDAAHDLCQAGDPNLDWVHAWLHRQEGDLANAGYWYRQANRSISPHSLEQEWDEIVEEFLAFGDSKSTGA